MKIQDFSKKYIVKEDLEAFTKNLFRDYLLEALGTASGFNLEVMARDSIKSLLEDIYDYAQWDFDPARWHDEREEDGYYDEHKGDDLYNRMESTMIPTYYPPLAKLFQHLERMTKNDYFDVYEDSFLPHLNTKYGQRIHRYAYDLLHKC